jgi:Zn-dependent peptidase ImmA (M78 family)
MQSIEYLDLDPAVCLELEEKARGKLASLFKTSRIIKDEVFAILDREATLLQYPVEDDEICGFVCCKKGRTFAFVNSHIPYEKQIFAAAHELYHIWYDQDVLNDGEIIKREVLDNALLDGQYTDREAMANRFAAVFLVPTSVLRDEIDYLTAGKCSEITLNTVVYLMNTFGVPYKTIVRRLYETGYINQGQCMEWLQIPDRDPGQGIMALQNRLQIGQEMNHRTCTVRLGDLVEKATAAFENDLITEERLTQLLALARQEPADLGIATSKVLPSEEDVLKVLDDD